MFKRLLIAFALCALVGFKAEAQDTELQRIADVFEAQNYSMKRVFAETATYCMGQ